MIKVKHIKQRESIESFDITPYILYERCKRYVDIQLTGDLKLYWNLYALSGNKCVCKKVHPASQSVIVSS